MPAVTAGKPAADEHKGVVAANETGELAQAAARRRRVAQVIASAAAIGFIVYGIRQWRSQS